MPRPTKATPQLIDALKWWLESGMSLKDSARMVGIDPRTLHRWIRRGFRGDAPEFERVRAIVNDARRDAGVDLVKTPLGLRMRRRFERPPTPRQVARLMNKVFGADVGAVGGGDQQTGGS